jgi:predicted small metal-binding protein
MKLTKTVFLFSRSACVFPGYEIPDNGYTNEDMMLFKYTCKGMGLNCPFMISGITVEEVTEKALEHVLENHTKEFKSIKTPEEIEQMKQALARSTRVVVG